MRGKKRYFISILLCIGISTGAFAQSRNILDVVSGSPELHIMAHLMVSNDVQGIYSHYGDYTVFAPSDAAMNQLPRQIMSYMLNPNYYPTTQSIINYHILPGRLTEKDIMAAIKKGNGQAKYKTIMGGVLVFTLTGDYVKITDDEGHTANVRFSSLNAGNGLVHTIDKVMMPRDDQPAKGVVGSAD